MKKLTQDNYYNDKEYLSNSRFKQYKQCQAMAFAIDSGELADKRDKTPLILGNYVHTYFESSEAHAKFVEELEVAMKLEQDKVAKLEAEKEFRKIKNKTTRESKKTHDEYVIERKAILSNMRESLRKSASVTYVTLPLVPQLKAIAPHVKLLVESYVREGLSKLDSVINKIYDEIKDDIEGITKSDINDIVTGKQIGRAHV